MTELNIVLTSFKLIYVIIILSMANQGGDVDWNKKRQQAQPYINKIRSLLEKKMQWFEQVGFLRKCQKEKMIPKGLRVKIPTSVDKTDYGQRLKNRSEKRVLKRAISDLYVKMQRTEKEIADANLYLMQNLNMPRGWTDRMGRWVYNSLKETRQKIRERLQLKLENLRKVEKE